jgi:pyruvate kinase
LWQNQNLYEKSKNFSHTRTATDTQEKIEQLIGAGLNAVRINMSHGTQNEHGETIRMARAAAKNLAMPLAVLVDLSGPKIRTGKLRGGRVVFLETGARFVITSREVEGTAEEVSTNYKELPKLVEIGARVLLDDGAIELVVESDTETDVVTRVVSGGLLAERKGINLPNTSLPIPSLTEKDRVDLDWAMQQNVDYVALSFVRRAEDCREARNLIKKSHQRKSGRPLLVAKIEKAEAIENLDAILKETDGVMVARGDLGVETSAELVPVYQKQIIEKAVLNDKFVITATQMLQSMITSPRPTRAEASDVANAVWDGTDAVMLSAETAAGQYPVESVATMKRIIDSAETVKTGKLKRPVKFMEEPTGRTSQALCKSAAICAREITTEKSPFSPNRVNGAAITTVRSGFSERSPLPTRTTVRNQPRFNLRALKPFCTMITETRPKRCSTKAKKLYSMRR